MYKKIVLAYDGSDVGQKALLDCKELAQWSHATLWLVAVMPVLINFASLEANSFDPVLEAQERSRYQAILADGLQRLADAGYTTNGELLNGESVPEITNFASRVGADLIVVGHKHLDGWAARWWRGGNSGALIEHAPCSVLCVITC
jgi:nucleotide-binding universal stress UspA family protein